MVVIGPGGRAFKRGGGGGGGGVQGRRLANLYNTAG